MLELPENVFIVFYFYRDMPPLIDYHIGTKEEVKRKVYGEIAADKNKVKAKIFYDYIKDRFMYCVTIET